MEVQEEFRKVEGWASKHKGMLAIAGLGVGLLAVLLASRSSSSGQRPIYLPSQTSGGSGSNPATATAGISAAQLGEAVTGLQNTLKSSQDASIAREGALRSDYLAQIDRVNKENESRYQAAITAFQNANAQNSRANYSSTNQDLARMFESISARFATGGNTGAQSADVTNRVNSSVAQVTARGSTVASEWQTLFSQNSQVQRDFGAAYGSSAAIAWQKEHELELQGIFSPQHQAAIAGNYGAPAVVQNVVRTDTTLDFSLPAVNTEPSAYSPPAMAGNPAPVDTGPVDTGPVDTGPVDTGPVDTAPDAPPDQPEPGTGEPTEPPPPIEPE